MKRYNMFVLYIFVSLLISNLLFSCLYYSYALSYRHRKSLQNWPNELSEKQVCSHIIELNNHLFFLNYLKICSQFGSAEPKNLWKGIQEAVDSAGINYNISEIMDPWINQVGIPLIRVERNYTSNTVKFSQVSVSITHDNLRLSINEFKFQEIFNTTYENKSAPGNWWVPLNGVSSKNLGFNITAATDWISGRPNKTVTDLGASLDEWIIINNQQTGKHRKNFCFFLVN